MGMDWTTPPPPSGRPDWSHWDLYTSSPPPPPPTTTTTPPCVATYIPMAGHSTEAELRHGVDTWEECQQMCTEEEMCNSWEMAPESNTCMMMNMAIEANKGSTTYVKQRCADQSELADNEVCEEFYVQYTDQQIEGGKGYKKRDTYEKCQKKCDKEATCYGFDFVTKENPWQNTRCWLHYMNVDDAGSTVYLKAQCPTILWG